MNSDGVAAWKRVLTLWIICVSMLSHLVAEIPGESKLVAADGALGDWFGYSVSMSDSSAIVGTFKANDNGNNSGAAYIFRMSNGIWIQEAKLLASDGATLDQFGWAVGIDGDYAIAGALTADGAAANSGAAYIFYRSVSGGSVEWIEVAKIFADSGGSWDDFGWSVSISGSYAIVGARNQDAGSTDSGAAYLCHRDGDDPYSWNVGQLLAGDGAVSDEFGTSVAIDGEIAIAGAVYADANGTDSGAIYVFEKDPVSTDPLAWLETAKLVPADGAAFDNLGQSVAISGSRIVGGAPFHDALSFNTGAAFVFDKNGELWAETARLYSEALVNSVQFGSAVGGFGSMVVVGAFEGGPDGYAAGQAYIFLEDEAGIWSEARVLNPSDGELGDWFGFSVAARDMSITAGAFRNSEMGAAAGAAYHYDLTHPFVSAALADMSVIEDFESFVAAELDSVFDDLDSDPLVLSASSDGNTLVNLEGSALWLSSLEGFTGTSEVTVQAIDEQQAMVTDTFFVFVEPATSIEQPPAAAESFRLEQNYPNPFNPATVIGYSLSVNSSVTLDIYNLSGQRIRHLAGRGGVPAAIQPAGTYEVTWDGRDDFGNTVASGVYFYRLAITGPSNLQSAIRNPHSLSRKMVLLR